MLQGESVAVFSQIGIKKDANSWTRGRNGNNLLDAGRSMRLPLESISYRPRSEAHDYVWQARRNAQLPPLSSLVLYWLSSKWGSL
jgi:hypothetical protein